MLNIADLLLSINLIETGRAFEGNPLLRGPIWSVVLIKFFMIVLVVRFLSGKTTVMRLLNGGLGLVVGWNLFWFLAL